MINENRDSLLFRLWFLVITLLIAANLALVSFNLSTTEAISINPTAAYENITGRSRFDSMRSFASGMLNSAGSAVRAPIRFFGTISKPHSLASVIRPATTNQAPVPVINANTDPIATAANVSTSQTIHTKNHSHWPLHGVITTEFGVPEMPYEQVHTGLDISDGRPSGITPVKPFLPGTVVSVSRDGGLGNHIVVDHGSGLTSVYGHLYSISVHQGERVTENSTLGYEGSTGASTGTHLHFEVRLNGRPENPKKFIAGSPG